MSSQWGHGYHTGEKRGLIKGAILGVSLTIGAIELVRKISTNKSNRDFKREKAR